MPFHLIGEVSAPPILYSSRHCNPQVALSALCRHTRKMAMVVAITEENVLVAEEVAVSNESAYVHCDELQMDKERIL